MNQIHSRSIYLKNVQTEDNESLLHLLSVLIVVIFAFMSKEDFHPTQRETGLTDTLSTSVEIQIREAIIRLSGPRKPYFHPAYRNKDTGYIHHIVRPSHPEDLNNTPFEITNLIWGETYRWTNGVKRHGFPLKEKGDGTRHDENGNDIPGKLR